MDVCHFLVSLHLVGNWSARGRKRTFDGSLVPFATMSDARHHVPRGAPSVKLNYLACGAKRWTSCQPTNQTRGHYPKKHGQGGGGGEKLHSTKARTFAQWECFGTTEMYISSRIPLGLRISRHTAFHLHEHPDWASVCVPRTTARRAAATTPCATFETSWFFSR